MLKLYYGGLIALFCLYLVWVFNNEEIKPRAVARNIDISVVPSDRMDGIRIVRVHYLPKE